MNVTNNPNLSVNKRSINPNFPKLAQPQIVGFYSLDTNRDYQNDARNLSYYSGVYPTNGHAQVHFDMNLKYDEAKKKPQATSTSEQIDSLLKYLIHNGRKHLSRDRTRLFNAEFICYRGLMTAIMATPYERDALIIHAAFVHGNIYLCQIPTPERLRRNETMSEFEVKTTAWGYKFEQFLLSSDPQTPPEPNQPCDENEEFCCVFETKLNDKTVMYAAEMDGVYARNRLDPVTTNELNQQRFVELKTTRIVENERQEWNFRRSKAMKWWAQSFLVGIEDIVAGNRNNNGVVESLELFRVRDLYKRANQWNGGVCLNMLNQFLAFVSQTIKRDLRTTNAQTVWIFNKHENDDVITVRRQDDGQTFIRDWFVRDINTLAENHFNIQDVASLS